MGRYLVGLRYRSYARTCVCMNLGLNCAGNCMMNVTLMRNWSLVDWKGKSELVFTISGEGKWD